MCPFLKIGPEWQTGFLKQEHVRHFIATKRKNSICLPEKGVFLDQGYKDVLWCLSWFTAIYGHRCHQPVVKKKVVHMLLRDIRMNLHEDCTVTSQACDPLPVLAFKNFACLLFHSKKEFRVPSAASQNQFLTKEFAVGETGPILDTVPCWTVA